MAKHFFQELFGLQGKVALVTGASSGLGAEFAKGLAKAGAKVAIVARREERLLALATQIEVFGGICLPVKADIADESQIRETLAKVKNALGAVDVLVNNAGIAHVGIAEAHGLKEWEETLLLNMTAAFRLSQQVALGMIKRKSGGRIINVTSIAGEASNPIYPTVAYSASKGGLAAMTRQLAVEWARHDITVNALAPGWFPTEMTRDNRFEDVHPRFKKKMEERTPMGRLGKPNELVTALLYLASPGASFTTGTTLAVDGGWLAW